MKRNAKCITLTEFRFLSTCICLTIGIGNYIHFPYACYVNGGGVFLFCYVILLIIIGAPIYYLDAAVGQFSGRATIFLYRNLGLGWTGIGIVQMLICFICLSYNQYTISLFAFLMYAGFLNRLPIITNDTIKERKDNVLRITYDTENITSVNMYPLVSKGNFTIGVDKWKIFLTMAIVCILWALRTRCRFRSEILKYEMVGRVFLLLIICLSVVRGFFLPGAADGLLYLLKPNFIKFLSPRIWFAALQQVLVNLSLGYGTIATIATANTIYSKLKMVAVITPLVDFAVCVPMSLATFGWIGFTSKKLSLKMGELKFFSYNDLGMAAYSGIFTQTIPTVPQLSVLGFLLLLLGTIENLCSYHQVLITNLIGIFPRYPWKMHLIVTAIAAFVMATLFLGPGATQIAAFIDMQLKTTAVLVIFLQLLLFTQIYGIQFLCWDLELMQRTKCGYYWRWTWTLIIPSIILFLFIAKVIVESIELFSGSSQMLGFILFIFFISPIVIVKIIYLSMLRCRNIKLMYGTEDWLPLLDDEAEAAEEFRDEKMETYPLKDAKKIKQNFTALIKKY